jgi:hypothetical protein
MKKHALKIGQSPNQRSVDKGTMCHNGFCFCGTKDRASCLLMSLQVIGYLSPALGTRGNGFHLGFSGFPGVARLV